MKSGDVEERSEEPGEVQEKPPCPADPGVTSSPSTLAPRPPQPTWPQGPLLTLRDQPGSSLDPPAPGLPVLPPQHTAPAPFPTATSLLVTMLLVVMSLTCPRDSVVPAEGPPPPHTPLSSHPRLPQIHIKNQPAL